MRCEAPEGAGRPGAVRWQHRGKSHVAAQGQEAVRRPGHRHARQHGARRALDAAIRPTGGYDVGKVMQIRKGMSLAEVEALLGGPPSAPNTNSADLYRGLQDGFSCRRWFCGTGDALVIFDPRDKVRITYLRTDSAYARAWRRLAGLVGW